MKILLPFWIVNIITMLIYRTIGAGCSLDVLQPARVHEAFVMIGQRDYSFMQYVMSALGVYSIDRAMWFVYIVIYSYGAFLISKTVFNIDTETIKVALVYISFIVILYTVLFYLNAPIHQYRSLWALALGMVLFVVEKMGIGKIIQVTIFALAFGIFILPTALSERNIILCAFAFLVPLSIVLVNPLFCHIHLKDKSVIELLALSSYVMYLVHCKFLTLEWWYMGYKSALLVVLLSFMSGMIYNNMKLQKK